MQQARPVIDGSQSNRRAQAEQVRIRLKPFIETQRELGLFMRIARSMEEADAYEVVISTHEGTVVGLRVLETRDDALAYCRLATEAVQNRDPQALIILDYDPQL